MTIAIVWREADGLWAAADTRFSNPGSADSAQILTDHGPKILPLPITVGQPGPAGFFDQIQPIAAIGFVYAGGIVPALSTHAFCSAALQRLISNTGSRRPTLRELSTFIGHMAERYIREWGQLHPSGALFKAIIFGWCGVQEAMEAYLLAPSIDPQLSVKISRIDLDRPFAIGSGAPEVQDQLNLLQPPANPTMPVREPLRILEGLIGQERRHDVGGSVQLAYATSAGISFLGRTRPIHDSAGRPIPISDFLGLNVEELPSVGPCKISIMSLT
jgi:hypothetical protein